MTTVPVTERYVSDHADLDLRSTLDLVELINDEDAKVAAAVRGASPTLAAAIDAIVARLEDGGRLVYVGAGSSGRLALVDAAECGPTFGVPAEQVVALASGASERDAEAALEAAGGEVKVAIVSLLSGLDASGARARLEASGGVL